MSRRSIGIGIGIGRIRSPLVEAEDATDIDGDDGDFDAKQTFIGLLPPPSNDNDEEEQHHHLSHLNYSSRRHNDVENGDCFHQSPGESSEDTSPTRNHYDDKRNNNYITNNNNTEGENTNGSNKNDYQEQEPQSSSFSNSKLTLLQSFLPTPSLIMKRLLRTLALSSSAIMLLIVFPLLFRYAITDAQRGSTSAAAFYSAASFVVISLVLSIRSILSHLLNWYAPDVQKFVVRILFMVPLYSVQSWLGLRFHGQARIYIILLRDLYEAYVIQSFVYYLIELLGGEDRMATLLSQKDPRLGGHGKVLSHVLPQWEMGMEFLLKIKYGVLQYVVVKTFMTLITTFVLLPSGLYGEGSFGLDSAYIYTTVILNISVMHALYCLVKLFHAIKSDLRHPINWHPVGKFLCVKGIVFFTWWQGVAIYFLRSYGVIGDVGNWSGADVAGGIIDYLVCVEMVIFSIAHTFTFTYEEYLPEEMRRRGGGEVREAEEEEDNEVMGRVVRIRWAIVKIWNTGSGFISWLFDGIDKRRRANHYNHVSPTSRSNIGRQQTTLHSALLHYRDDDENEGDNTDTISFHDDRKIADESAYRPPPHAHPVSTQSSSGFSKLEDPLSLREALWSSTVPRETFKDIKRLRVVSGLPGSSFKTGGGQGDSSNVSLSSLHNTDHA